MTSVGIVYHSGFGHTAALARAVAEGVVTVPGTSARMVFAEDAAGDPHQLDGYDALVLGCPTYMAGPSAGFKEFMDATSGIWLKQGWKDKLAAGFTNSGGYSGDKLNTLVQLMLFAMQHGMVWVGLGLPDGGSTSASAGLNRLGSYAGAMAKSDVDLGMDGTPESDVATAEALGRRVALAALRWRVSERVEK
ncbi:flavodoxin family protein [Amycolatopsis alkalitolerans]|uniref:Flavodoxin family protein n=1 Tax=Amycolatopsis alkalitolerans TaxID=2547244 RepID=A0A5C4MCM9_9PSEU|nr:flavodoxin family protein [Amycolatopsis alkalitolerans]TNC29192.1 flavodoxin family protein [Amycolatopsis alkalitolerans]